MNCLNLFCYKFILIDMVFIYIVMISNINVKVFLKSEFNLELKLFSYLKNFCIMF